GGRAAGIGAHPCFRQCFFFQAEDGIRDFHVTGVQTCALPILLWMILTIIGGLTFLGCQALEWTHLNHQGFWFGAIPESIPLAEQQGATQFSSLFFAITGLHGVHVTVGITLNIIIFLMTLANVFERRGTYLMIEKVGLYCHFVDLVWVFVFTFFYLV